MANKVVILYEDEFEMYERCKEYVETKLLQAEEREGKIIVNNPAIRIFRESDYLRNILRR